METPAVPSLLVNESWRDWNSLEAPYTHSPARLLRADGSRSPGLVASVRRVKLWAGPATCEPELSRPSVLSTYCYEWAGYEGPPHFGLHGERCGRPRPRDHQTEGRPELEARSPGTASLLRSYWLMVPIEVRRRGIRSLGQPPDALEVAGSRNACKGNRLRAYPFPS